jgi:hypothetical protein
MVPKPRTPEETYEPALAKATSELARIQPQDAAARASVSYEHQPPQNGSFLVPFLGKLYDVHWPDGSVYRTSDRHEADVATRILLLHYLLNADGSPPTSKWIAFRNLPGGLGYDAAFQRRASLRLVQAFGTDKEAFVRAARRLGGEPLDFGEASFLFRALPSLWLAVVLHLADDEFPASANVLFDAVASHYLPTEDLAVLGGILAGGLIKAARTEPQAQAIP